LADGYFAAEDFNLNSGDEGKYPHNRFIRIGVMDPGFTCHNSSGWNAAGPPDSAIGAAGSIAHRRRHAPQ